MTFGERLQVARKKQGLSQEQVAECLHVSRQAVAKWEKDASEPSVEMLIRLSEILAIDLSYLLKGEVAEAVSNDTVPEIKVVYVEKNSDIAFRTILNIVLTCVSFIGMLILFLFAVTNPFRYSVLGVYDWLVWFVPHSPATVVFVLVFVLLFFTFIISGIKLYLRLVKKKGEKNV